MITCTINILLATRARFLVLELMPAAAEDPGFVWQQWVVLWRNGYCVYVDHAKFHKYMPQYRYRSMVTIVRADTYFQWYRAKQVTGKSLTPKHPPDYSHT